MAELTFRYFIEFAYLGTNYSGWQIQPHNLTVQERLEKAFSTLLKQKIEITGSSRTDSGVHAQQQFAHFDVDFEITDTSQLVYRLNKMLPADVAIRKIFRVNTDYHSRFEASSRRYEYRIARRKDPFQSAYSYHFEAVLDVKQMNECCEILLKHIDFECFSKVHTQVFTFNCNILEAFWEEQEHLLIFHIKANRFLRGMVRAIVGTLLEVGLGRMNAEEFEAVILSKNRQKAGRAVPAHGLFLMEVNYV